MDSNERYELRFELRYAQHVLEMHARLFRRIDLLTKAIGFLAGTAAFAAIVGNKPYLTLAIGGVLAVSQAFQYLVRPAERSWSALQALRPYRHLQGESFSMDDAELRQRLESVKAADDYQVLPSLKSIAYNAAARELGCEAQFEMPLSFSSRVLSVVA